MLDDSETAVGISGRAAEFGVALGEIQGELEFLVIVRAGLVGEKKVDIFAHVGGAGGRGFDGLVKIVLLEFGIGLGEGEIVKSGGRAGLVDLKDFNGILASADRVAGIVAELSATAEKVDQKAGAAGIF